MTILNEYIKNCNTISDINEHLPTLLEFGKKCKTITEFGVRNVVSTWAFALARPLKLVCIDILRSPNVDSFLKKCKEENINAEFILGDTLKINLEETDLLFIDTLHNYKQLKTELNIHYTKVKKYIILHDTISFGTKDEVGVGKGLLAAIKEFLNEHSEWIELISYRNNNGLTILKNNGI